MSTASGSGVNSAKSDDTEEFWNKKKESLQSIKQNIRNGKRSLLGNRATPATGRYGSRQAKHAPTGKAAAPRLSTIAEPRESDGVNYRNYLRRRFPHIAAGAAASNSEKYSTPPQSPQQLTLRQKPAAAAAAAAYDEGQHVDTELLESYIYFCENHELAQQFIDGFVTQHLDEDEIPDVLMECVAELSNTKPSIKKAATLASKRAVHFPESPPKPRTAGSDTGADPLAPEPDDSEAVTDILQRIGRGAVGQRRPRLQPLPRTPRQPPLTSPTPSPRSHTPLGAAGIDALQLLLRDELPELLRDIAVEAVGEQADGFVSQIDIADIIAPFLLNSTIGDMLEEVCMDAIKELATQEVAKGFHYDIFLELVDEILMEVGPVIARRAVGEDFVEGIVDELVEPVVDQMTRDVVFDVLHDYNTRLRRRDFKEIERTAKQKPLESLIFQHLLDTAAASGDSGAITSRTQHRFLEGTELDILLKQQELSYEARRSTLDCYALKFLHKELFVEAAAQVLLEEYKELADEELADLDMEEVQDAQIRRHVTDIRSIYEID